MKTQALTEKLREDASGVRTSRPSAALVENLRASYYDQSTPLKQLGSISVIPPREIVIQVWDKGAVPAVVKAVEGAGIGLTANTEGTTIRLFLPELSHERREELVKYVRKMTEEHRIQLRHLRDEVNKQIQRQLDAGEVNEDQRFRLKEEVQKRTDATNADIDRILEAKVKEVLE